MVVEPGKINPVVGSIFCHGFKLTTIMAILIGVLTILYVSAALMMIRIDRLHNAYLNHPFVTPERLTQDHLLHYLNTNLEQIVKVHCFKCCAFFFIVQFNHLYFIYLTGTTKFASDLRTIYNTQ